MGLRLKVILLLVAVVVPVTVAFTLFRIGAERRAIQERMADRVATRAAQRPPRRCERDPQAFHHERRGLSLWAYDPRFASRHPEAPPFPPQLRQGLADDDGPVHTRMWFGGPWHGATAVRAAEQGPCAILLIGWTDRGRPAAARIGRTVLWQTLTLLGLLLVVGTIISVPLVRRIRRLTVAVRQAPESGWRVGVETDAGDEIGELARAFDDTGERIVETIERLEARDQALNEYVQNTTHDISVPLTVLQHRLRRAREAVRAGASDAEAILEAALEESHYIAALVANMSAAVRLEAAEGLVTRHDFELGALVERVAQRHAPIAAQRSVELNWAVPPEPVEAYGDSTLIEQALSNLVQNAVQYNAAGGHVSIVLEDDGGRAGDGSFELRVLDDGPGIPPELIERVDERAIRADDARSRNPGGQGFGLAIARRVFDQHGWTMTLSNRPDGGLEARIAPSAPKNDINPHK